MSTIVFIGTPAYGHVNPSLPVVHELAQRGERVVYYNDAEFRVPIEGAGASFRPYPPKGINRTAIADALQEGSLVNIAGLILSTTERLLPFLSGDVPQCQPDLILFDSMALWGRMAATALHMRAASSISHFVFDTRHFMSGGQHSVRYLGQLLPQLPQLLTARARIARRYKAYFPKDPPLIPVRGGLNLMYTSRELQPESAVIDATFRFVGPSVNPQIRAHDFPLDALKEKPVVYISLGTIHTGQVEFFRLCFEAFGDGRSGCFVLSTGSGVNPSAVGSIPTHFIVSPTVPQLEVLTHTDVFVTHAGMNSIHEALYHGVPMVLIPQQLEQLLNARVVAQQGAGIVLEQPLSHKPLSADALRRAVDEVLSNDRYRQAAGRLEGTLRSTGGYRRAADEIQTFLAQGG